MALEKTAPVWYSGGMTIKLYGKIHKKELKLGRYAGEWVAFVNGKVVMHDHDLRVLMKRVQEKRLEKRSSVLLVPRRDEGPYILIVLQ